MPQCREGHEATGKITRGYCVKHYRRWQRHGDTSIVKPGGHARGAFLGWRHVLITETCWLWTGPLNHAGYGRSGSKLAHRVIFARLGGSIPPRLELDHLCRVPACVNPAHMEPVTRGENVRRAYAARRVLAVSA